jgi:hypothetical protein
MIRFRRPNYTILFFSFFSIDSTRTCTLNQQAIGMKQHNGLLLPETCHGSRCFSGIYRIKKICITGLRFFCVIIAIVIDIKPVQTLVHDTPRDSICKIFILVQEFRFVEFFSKVMPDFMREDKFNIFSFAGHNDLVALFKE